MFESADHPLVRSVKITPYPLYSKSACPARLYLDPATPVAYHTYHMRFSGISDSPIFEPFVEAEDFVRGWQKLSSLPLCHTDGWT